MKLIKLADVTRTSTSLEEIGHPSLYDCQAGVHKILERCLTSQVLRTIVHLLEECIDELVSNMLKQILLASK